MNETQRIPVVALTLDKSIKKYNEFDISNKVRERTSPDARLTSYRKPQERTRPELEPTILVRKNFSPENKKRYRMYSDYC
jgi:hypothetical protein